MKVAFIEPIPSLGVYDTDIHMILPGLPSADAEEYYGHYKEIDGYKILDNGEAESWGSPGFDELFDLADNLGVHEIVAPDVMGSAQGTIESLSRFAPTGLERMDDYAFMGVAQGNSMAEIVATIQWMANQEWITVLGLPRILSNNVHKYMRCTIMESELGKNLIPKSFSGGVHCLGGARFAREAVLLGDHEGIRSMDTSYVASMSLLTKDIRRDDFSTRPANFWDAEYPDDVLADRNHETYLDWCNAL